MKSINDFKNLYYIVLFVIVLELFFLKSGTIMIIKHACSTIHKFPHSSSRHSINFLHKFE